MFIGHYGPAFVAATSRRAPPLGLLFVAAQLIDLAFFSFLLFGVERMRLVPGMTRMNPMDLYHMPWTHSLVGATAWALGFAALLWLWRRSRAAALIGGAVVVSHWVIDLLVHRPDLTIAGSPPALGLALWNYPAIEIPLELAFAFGGLAFFLARTHATGARAWLAPTVLAITMAGAQAFNWFGPSPSGVIDPPPPSLALSGLAAYGLLAMLAWWVGRTREAKA